jgi:hypothetical protein
MTRSLHPTHAVRVQFRFLLVLSPTIRPPDHILDLILTPLCIICFISQQVFLLLVLWSAATNKGLRSLFKQQQN